jgi:hypothetical protein
LSLHVFEQTNKTNDMSKEAFADLKEAMEGALAFERGERRELKILASKHRGTRFMLSACLLTAGELAMVAGRLLSDGRHYDGAALVSSGG